jgi:BlaI family transcriptional regulator, penicillinase repressor
MKKTKTPLPTDLELEIMQIVWGLGHCTVRDVHEALLEQKKVAYTTVMTVMSILEQKGHLVREKEGRAYRYRPARSKGKVVSEMVEDFLSRVFQGSAKPLVMRLVHDRRLSKADIEEIAKMVKEAGDDRADGSR